MASLFQILAGSVFIFDLRNEIGMVVINKKKRVFFLFWRKLILKISFLILLKKKNNHTTMTREIERWLIPPSPSPMPDEVTFLGCLTKILNIKKLNFSSFN